MKIGQPVQQGAWRQSHERMATGSAGEPGDRVMKIGQLVRQGDWISRHENWATGSAGRLDIAS
jgi:hypothetical protein